MCPRCSFLFPRIRFKYIYKTKIQFRKQNGVHPCSNKLFLKYKYNIIYRRFCPFATVTQMD